MALRQSKKKAPKREDKRTKIEWPLEEGVFDRNSLLTLEKFMKKGIIYTLDYCIARGKEANVYRATGAKGEFYAIKMYRLKSPSFLHMQKYIEGDRRFERAGKNKQDMVFIWTKKEFSNLKILHEAKLPVPKPIAFKHNVLAMEFLGENGVPYSKLSEVDVQNPKKDKKTILGYIEKMRKAGLVHADLSKYNILTDGKNFYIIDVGQAVLTSHPAAEEFYKRDKANIEKYFSKFEQS